MFLGPRAWSCPPSIERSWSWIEVTFPRVIHFPVPHELAPPSLRTTFLGLFFLGLSKAVWPRSSKVGIPTARVAETNFEPKPSSSACTCTPVILTWLTGECRGHRASYSIAPVPQDSCIHLIELLAGFSEVTPEVPSTAPDIVLSKWALLLMTEVVACILSSSLLLL